MNKNKPGLRITKEGRLIETYWEYLDDESVPQMQRGRYLERDVTRSAIRRLWDVCDLEEGVNLKSVFILLNSEINAFDLILGNWCKEIVHEGLTVQAKQYTGFYNPNEIEYLELYWHIQRDATWEETPEGGKYNPERTILLGTKRPDLHGVGYELKEDMLSSFKSKNGESIVESSKGSRINWSLSFLKSNDIVNIPIRLKKETIIYDEASYWRSPSQFSKLPPVAEFQESEYTLGDILNGIIWELSFFGDPSSRDKKGEELKSIAKKIDLGYTE